MATCYRHPKEETGVSCSNCGRPICPDCMTPTPVGMRCPECARDRTKVRTLRTIGSHGFDATKALIAINVIAFLTEGGSAFTTTGQPGADSWTYLHGALWAPFLRFDHQYYRLLTSGFLHEDLLHIGSNMLVLFFVGRLLEPAIGRTRFISIYLVALLAGSLGALLLNPTDATVGASGAIFGVMGAAFVDLRRRGIDPWASGIGPTIILNLILSVSIAGISLGAHLGGLIAGALVALLWQQADRRRHALAIGLSACAAIAAVVVVASILFAQTVAA
jgi:membrane associated rhomboid family serine protease